MFEWVCERDNYYNLKACLYHFSHEHSKIRQRKANVES